MTVTRRDVAKMARVSEATVSYVMNNTKKITPEVRQRVLDAARDLNYRPSLLAKSLVTKETKHIAMLVDNIQNPHYMLILRGIQDAAEREGYIVSIVSMHHSAQDIMAELVSRGVDGVILAVGFFDAKEYDRLLAELTLPAVYENDSLLTSYRRAIFDMVHHFRELGHRRVAFLSGLPLQSEPHVRYHDFRDALAFYDMEICEELLISGTGYTDEAAGYNAADQLLARGRDFTAVFALNDLMAVGALKRLWDAGFHIPTDISVVGCDGIPGTAYTVPALSTIQSHACRLGEALMQRLLAKLHPERGLPEEKQVIEAEFLPRQSTGPCRTASLEAGG